MKLYNFAFVFLAFVFLMGCTQPIVVSDQDKDVNTLMVEGVAEFDTAPDEAIISFAIETQNKDAKVAQTENKEKANEVMHALWLAGISKDKIESTHYNMHKLTEWEHDKRVDKGYRVTNTITVTLEDLDKVGKVIDVVVDAGVNRVNNVDFALSDTKKAEVKAEALRLAAENAKSKAEALALGSGVTLGKIKSIQEVMFDYYPMRGYGEKTISASMDMDEGAYMPPTPISPEQVHIQVKVKVVYTI